MLTNQQEAYKKLSRLKVGALFMEMGTGKTKVALDLINSKRHKVDYVLWICPFSLKNEINAEIKKWGYENLGIHIMGCESLGASDRIFYYLMQELKGKKIFTIVDESLKIKNSDAKRTRRILEIGDISEYRLILNGTPVSKSVMDLWTQMRFLSYKILNMTESDFKNTFCEYYIRGRLKGLVKRTYNVPYLISLIDPYIYECKLDIGTNKNYDTVLYENTNTEEYEDIKAKYIDQYDRTEVLDFYSMSTELQQSYTKCYKSQLAKTIEEINAPVIVYVKYLANIPSDSKSITGATKLEERERILQDFKNGKFQVLYMTYGVGSFGLNLQYCQNIIFADQSFDYSQKVQAEYRIYRMGQEKEVNYYNLICDCGMEDMIVKSLNKKSDLLTEIKREIKSKGEKEWLKSL